MLIDPDHPVLTSHNPCVLTLITESPGALAISELDLAQPDVMPAQHVLPLAQPRRGKRFANRTPVGRILQHLHAQDRLARFTINLPDRYRTLAEFVDRQEECPDLLHFLRRLERMQAPARLTLTSVWRPFFDEACKGGTYASQFRQDFAHKLLDTPHAAEQCFDALLLGFHITCMLQNRVTPPVEGPVPFRLH